MKTWIVGIILMCSVSVLAGSLDLPVERIAMGVVHLNNSNVKHLVCIWDDSSQSWLQNHQTYDHSGSYEFQFPEWGKWYWIGLWNTQTGEYIIGRWVGHFK